MNTKYYIVPITDPAVECDDFDTACEEAQLRAESDGIFYALVQDDNAVYFPPPDAKSLAEEWRGDLKPGVDYPATLY